MADAEDAAEVFELAQLRLTTRAIERTSESSQAIRDVLALL